MSLTGPPRAIARDLLEDVPDARGMSGTVMAMRRGAHSVTLPSMEAVESFLEDRSLEEIQALGFDVDVNYVDLADLARWLRETLGDVELADEVAEIASSGRPFGPTAGEVKRLLAERIEQCHEVLGIPTRSFGDG